MTTPQTPETPTTPQVSDEHVEWLLLPRAHERDPRDLGATIAERRAARDVLPRRLLPLGQKGVLLGRVDRGRVVPARDAIDQRNMAMVHPRAARELAVDLLADRLAQAKQWRGLENDLEVARSRPTNLSGREGLDSDFLELVGHASPASRAVLLLHYQQHLSIEEAAAILDIPVGTAKSRLSYGIAVIRKYIEEKQEND